MNRPAPPSGVRHPIPLVAPCYDAADAAAVTAAAAGHAFDHGAITAALERAVAARLGLAGGVATTSGTAALHLALVALGVGPEDEVIFPSYTCVALIHATRLAGARAILVDNQASATRMDFNLDPAAVRAALTPRTRAVIVPHAFGVPADVRPLLDLGVMVIEDCPMAFGAAIDRRPAGSYGQITTISFHASKVISTGEGGMALARDPAVLARLREANRYAEAQVADRTAAPEQVAGSYRLRLNYRLTDPAAALGLSQLRKLDGFLARRRAIAARYNEALDGLPAVLPRDLPEGAIVFRYMLDAGPCRRPVPDLLAALARHGVEGGRGVYPTLHQYLGLPGWERSNAQRCAERMLSLPVHPSLTDAEVDRVIAATRAALRA